MKYQLWLTCTITKKGFSGMRSSSPASNSLYLYSDVLRIPFQAIANVIGNPKENVQQTINTLIHIDKIQYTKIPADK